MRRNLRGKRRLLSQIHPAPSSLSEAISRGLSRSTGQRRPSLTRGGGRTQPAKIQNPTEGDCGENSRVESTAGKIVENTRTLAADSARRVEITRERVTRRSRDADGPRVV